MRTSQLNPNTMNKSNLIKYLNPSKIIQNKQIKDKNNDLNKNIHCRSMQDLDLNANYSSHMNKQNCKGNIHHSSLFNENDQNRIEVESQKSKSLNKFMMMFQNSNILNTKGNSNNNEKVVSSKRKNYNGFSYDLKISAQSSNNQQKIIKKKQNNPVSIIKSQRDLKLLQNVNTNKSTIQANNKSYIEHHHVNNENSIIMIKMKQIVTEYKSKENILNQKINQLEKKNQYLQGQLKSYMMKIECVQNKQRQNQNKIVALESKNKQLKGKLHQLVKKNQKNSQNKQCKQHINIIKSLKKVINEQLNKIIQLEQFKIQNLEKKDHNDDNDEESNQYDSFIQQNQSQNDAYIESSRSKKSNNSSCKQAKKNNQKGMDNFYQFPKENFKKSQKYAVYAQINQPQLSQSNLNRKHFKSCFYMDQKSTSQQQLSEPYFCNSNNFNKKKQTSNMIKIRQSQQSFSNDAIEEVTEENQQNEYELEKHNLPKSHRHNISNKQYEREEMLNEEEEEEDSILNQVDEYLSKWRNK